MSGTKLEEFETTNHHQIQKLRYKWHMSKFLKKNITWPSSGRCKPCPENCAGGGIMRHRHFSQCTGLKHSIPVLPWRPGSMALRNPPGTQNANPSRVTGGASHNNLKTDYVCYAWSAIWHPATSKTTKKSNNESVICSPGSLDFRFRLVYPWGSSISLSKCWLFRHANCN